MKINYLRYLVIPIMNLLIEILSLSNRAKLVLTIFCVAIIALGVRPYTSFYETTLSHSPIGAWNMYKYDLRDYGAPSGQEHRRITGTIRLELDDAPAIEIDSVELEDKFIWHNRFLTSAIPDLSTSAAEGFLCFVLPNLQEITDHRIKRMSISFELWKNYSERVSFDASVNACDDEQ